jgi:hypothetical protein
MQKYSVNQRKVEQLLHYISEGNIVIPEIQRPFVWKSVKVRDLIDSLYQGYPIGYIITWKNPSVRLKNGELGGGKQVLIDGQQRVTALMAAVLGMEVVDESYKKRRIKIAFHPVEERFETLTPAIQNSKGWVHDISEFLQTQSRFSYLRSFLNTNEYSEEEQKLVEERLEKLEAVKNKDIGIVELDDKLEIEAVTEIFVRINSAGVPFEQADFAMSKIASYEPEDNPLYGVNLRKMIDYFAHLVRSPHFLEDISRNDKEFAQTGYLEKISWLGKEKDMSLYEPDYKDILRVSFVKEFRRGKVSDLVKLLSGQNFETREYDQSKQVESYAMLSNGLLDFISPTHFKRYLMILESAGFIDSGLINSQNVRNMGYVVYLRLRQDGIKDDLIEKYVRKWLVISILTERYSSSPESAMDRDIRDITKKGIENVIQDIEAVDLSDTYWEYGLVKDLEKGTINNPFLKLYFAAQVFMKDSVLFSKNMKVEQVIRHRGDVHHIFPRKYLQDLGYKRNEYNQIANLVYLQQEVNIRIGKKSPAEYFPEFTDYEKASGGLSSNELLEQNLRMNAIPAGVFQMGHEDYKDFLEQRRKLMAQKIKSYYKSL